MDGDPTAIDALSFEEALRRLEEIVHRLEAGEASLEDSIGLYTQGEALKAHCQAKLASAQARIERIQLGDRKSVVEGKSVSVRVDLGGGRLIKKKKKTNDGGSKSR